ncbi:hypothetical protein [Nocardia puris]|uniref:hypothetical protein n=1 Tax=Nocardia puris TaxID=208602 RepID=UPI0011BEF724|nr:hypothetical protein [Nocardia puris]
MREYQAWNMDDRLALRRAFASFSPFPLAVDPVDRLTAYIANLTAAAVSPVRSFGAARWRWATIRSFASSLGVEAFSAGRLARFQVTLVPGACPASVTAHQNHSPNAAPPHSSPRRSGRWFTFSRMGFTVPGFRAPNKARNRPRDVIYGILHGAQERARDAARPPVTHP